MRVHDGGRLALHAVVLLAALVYGFIAQGAFYAIQLSVLELALASAFVSGVHTEPIGRGDLRKPAVAAFAIVLVTNLVGAAVHRNVLPALLLDLYLVAVLAAVLVAGRLVKREVDAVVWGSLATACGVAIYGWLGVAFRWRPAALLNGPLWRASTSITYANAGASVLAICALVALARSTMADRMAKVAAYLCLVGLAATLSRGGAIAFVGGVVVLVACYTRRFLSENVIVFVAAGIAVAALLPSIPNSDRPNPGMAIAGLALGLGLVIAAPIVGTRSVAAAVIALAIVAVIVLHPEFTRAWHAVRAERLADDPSVRDRVDRWRTFIATFRGSPLFGGGPGSFLLHYPGQGSLDVGRFAHNEYLQILAEQGVLGVAGLTAALGVLARGLWKARSRDWLWVGGAAASVAFVIHGAFDFVWNVPVVPLLAATLYGLATSTTRDSRV